MKIWRIIKDIGPGDVPSWVEEEEVVKLREEAARCFERRNNGRLTIDPKKANVVLLYKLAKLYHRDGVKNGCTLKQIATILGITHASDVSKLLKEAESREMLKVHVKFPGESVETRLQAAFGLKRTARLASPGHDHNSAATALGKASADLLDDLIKERGAMSLAIGGGHAMHSLVDSLGEKRRALVISPLALFSRVEGGAVRQSRMMDSPFLAMALMWKSHCEGMICATPPLPELVVREARRYCRGLLDVSEALKKVLTQASESEVIFTGAAQMTDQSSVQITFERVGITMRDLKAMDCIGHLNFAAFNAQGIDITIEISKRLRMHPPREDCHPFIPAVSLSAIRTGAKDLRRDVVLVAGGPEKVPVIFTALQTKMCNCLVTDYDTAEKLLELHSRAI